MFVSVIVPNYNHENYLKERLDSILSQTYQNFEIILLDDASQDKSQVILQDYAKGNKVSYLVINEKNSGSPFNQWQKGFELAKGDLIWIAESDDFAEDNLLMSLVPFFKNSEVVVAYGQSYDVDEHGNKLFSRKVYSDKLDVAQWESDFIMDGPEFIEKYMIHANVIPNASAVLFRRSMVEKIDNEAFKVRRVGDWITWCSILRHGKIAFTPKVLNYFRFSPNNTRSNDKTRILEYVKTLTINKGIISDHIFTKKINYYLWEWVRAHNIFALFNRDYYRLTKISWYKSKDLILVYFKNIYSIFLKKVIWTYITRRDGSQFKQGKSESRNLTNKTDS